MNNVEKMIMQSLIDELKHVQKVYRSLNERGKYPQELVPFDLSGSSLENHPLYLGKQGFASIQLAIDAAEETMNKCETYNDTSSKYIVIRSNIVKDGYAIWHEVNGTKRKEICICPTKEYADMVVKALNFAQKAVQDENEVNEMGG